MQNNNIEPQNFQQDEIDFKELFSILSSSKNYIIAITLIFTILATGYAFITEKPPIYRAKALLMIGNIENEQFKKSNELYEELVVVFPNTTSYSFKEKTNKYISLTTQASSNALATEKINNVIDYLKKDSDEKLNKHLARINNEINLISVELEQISEISKIDQDIQKTILEFNSKVNQGEVTHSGLLGNNISIDLIEKILSERLFVYKFDLFFQQNKLRESLKDYTMTQIVGEIEHVGPQIEPKKQVIILGFFSGLFLSILLAFIRNALSKKIE